jgi:hypothetical protein|nr:MAG TPA: Protein of unknown function (DUF3138) [Caudoviricetes sp.]
MNNKVLVVGSLVAVSALSWFASKAYYDDKRNHEVESLREVLKTTERHIHALREEINSLKSKLSEDKPVEETKEDPDIPTEETAETESEDIPDERENISYRSTGNYTDYSKYYKPGVIKIPNIRVGWETVNNDIKIPYEEPGPITEDEFYEGANEDDWIRTTYSFYAGDRVLLNEHDIPVEQPEELLGKEFWKYIGEIDPEEKELAWYRNANVHLLAEVIEYDAYYYDNETHNPSLEVDDEVDTIDPAELEYPEDDEGDIDESEEVSADTDDDDGITIN